MGRSLSRFAISIAAALTLAACDAVRPVGGRAASSGDTGGSSGGAGGTAIDLAACTRCHGDASRGNAAPPFSVKGGTATSELGVGAHQQHLGDLTTRAPLRCDECHLVPASATEPGHMDGPFPSVRFDSPASTGLARSGGASPAWDRGSATCSGVYCHGATLSGGASTAPLWTRVDGSQKQCTSCHGSPPPAPHPSSTGCAACHPATVDALGNILVSGGKHLDGVVDVATSHPAGWSSPGQHGTAANGGLAQCRQCHGADLAGGTSGVSCDSCHGGGVAWRTDCTFCHGDASRSAPDALAKAAPPQGVAGETATSARAVGAHQSHLVAGVLARPIACGECHAVPQSALDAKHADGSRDVELGGALARAGGAAPFWDAQAGTCASTYCHGAMLSGAATRSAPSWAGAFTAGATTLGCASCHGNPPAGSHPASSACSQCHTGYGDKPSSGSQPINLATHVNGFIDVASLSCTSCHGDAARASVAGADPAQKAAPPKDAKGNTAATARGVGAHQAHVNGSRSRPVACSECHSGAVPISTAHSDGAATVAFGALAKTGGIASASYSATALTCASTYCHGNFTGGSGAGATPAWTASGALACSACHGNPPALPHPQDTACADCHGAGYSRTTVTASSHVDGLVTLAGSRSGCTACHGDGGRAPIAGADANARSAPPIGSRGETATTSRAVGAHLAHLNQRLFRSSPVACNECHAVPASGDEAHANGTASVAFGALARTGGAAPTWNGTTCASTYCHGGFTGGGGAAPAWTGTFTAGTSTLGCASCHGNPPAGSHPASSACSQCHTGYGDKPSSGPQSINLATHINGFIDVASLSCTSCHGDAARASVAGADPAQKAAPPKDAKGNTAATARGVGAHQAHVNRNGLAQPVSCATCHGAVPASTGHSNGAVAMSFTGLALTGGAVPTWNGTALSCASTYCHGQFKGGNGAAAAPAWTAAGQLGCGSCHGNPPPASVGHPQNASCGACHAGYGPSSVNAATHVNGRVEVAAMTCTSCHGTPGRTGADPYLAAAPPAGTRGETATTARAVGAHMKHLQGGAMRAAVACSECHALPSQQVHGNGTATVTFGALARTDGAAPGFNGTSCSSTYCHGSTLAAGGSLQAPSWTKVDGTQAACGTCHGVPPPTSSGHPAVTGGATACASCHPTTVKADGTIDVPGGKHIDGTLQVVSQSCTSCHGDAARTPAALAPAPPRGTHGETATTARPVGAHQAHLTGTAVRSAIACSECHTVPTSMNGHPTGSVGMTFGSLARTGGASPSWNGTTCASTYCHGATLSAGGTRTQPVWTTVDGTQRQCTSCHGAPPPTSSGHPAASTALTGCAGCHPATVKPDGTIDLAGGKHVDGALQVVSQSCTSCHGDPARTPAAIAPAPPRDAAGLTSSNAVGAHLRHLQGGSIRAAMQCADCHTVPSDSSHASQPLDLTWSALARSAGVVPSWNATSLTCTNYCHGITLPGGTETTPAWNQGSAAAACGACHGIPPPAASGHPTVSGGASSCNACHPATVTSTGVIDLAGGKHVNGVLEVTGGSCTSCHGDASRAAVAGADANVKSAPPVGTGGETATSTRAVGAHQAHLNKSAGAIANPTACSECHVVPSSSGHSDGTAAVTFGTLARTGGKSPTWSGTTCSASYCHGNFTGGATTAAPSWTGGAMTCTSCHGNPPSSGGHGRSQHRVACSTCHGTGYSSTAVNKAIHVNGVKNAGGAGSSITWNASTRSCAPSCHGSERW